MIEAISGIVVGVLVIILTRAFSGYFTTKLMATTILVAIAFIYVGFSLKDNPLSSIILEVAVAMIFYFMAVIGYTRNNMLLAYGILLHGVWDIFHHDGLFLRTDIPVYYPTFCSIVDIIDGVYFIIVFRNQKLNG